METWIHNEILDGLSRLLCLSLDRTPATDLIEGTAAMWVTAITKGRVWEQQFDAPRFRDAFATLALTRRTWPAPADFLEALPPRAQLALTKQPIKASPERAARAYEELGNLLRMK
jgi:hypothetical protein